ncbi:MAG: SpoVG family protein [Planctomycetes bacterium]|jgi:stage V sporulation protein G|nr:SpoVG family protein [Planctomycetota bacterium]
MRITEVRVRLVRKPDDKLKAFCSITLDDEFVVRDIKVIEGAEGYFIAMPSRKICDRCRTCGGKNHLGAKFCNACGCALSEHRAPKSAAGKVKLHADIAHPINAGCRQRIQERLVGAYRTEVEKSKLPGYKPAELDELDEDVPDVA